MVSSEVLTVADEVLVAGSEEAAVVASVAALVEGTVAAETVAAAKPAHTMLPTPGGLARPGIPTYPLGVPVKNISFGGSLLTGVRSPIPVPGNSLPHPRTRIETGTSP